MRTMKMTWMCVRLLVTPHIYNCIHLGNSHAPVQVNVSLCKDQSDTPLLGLMKRTGVTEVRRVLTKYVQDLKSGLLLNYRNDLLF